MERMFDAFGQAMYYYSVYEKNLAATGKTPAPFIKFVLGRRY